jgi:hypothetical protein
MDRIFVSKRDRWLAALMWASIFITVVAGFVLFAAMFIVSLTLFLVAALVLSIYYRTFYRVTNRKIFIHSGPFRWTIDPAHITEVTPTDSPLSAPACSLDRLRIVTASRSIMISPSDKIEFLKTLTAIDEGLVLDGDRVTRRQ